MNRIPEFLVTAHSKSLDRKFQAAGDNDLLTRPELYLTQNEEVYYLLKEPVTIRSFPVHHNLRQPHPNPAYLEAVETFFENLLAQIPSIMVATGWGFEPRDTFHPAIFQIIEVQARKYLYIARFDLTLRPRLAEVMKKGTNDETAEYQTRHIFVTLEILPLDTGLCQSDQHFVRWLFDSTWIGERGHGYYLQGIWMDDTITHFVSRLLFKRGTSFHPFYPIRCRYQSLSASLIFATLADRVRVCRGLDTVLEALGGRFYEIQRVLKSQDENEVFKLEDEFRSQGVFLEHPLRLPILSEPALNAWSQKEYFVYESDY